MNDRFNINNNQVLTCCNNFAMDLTVNCKSAFLMVSTTKINLKILKNRIAKIHIHIYCDLWKYDFSLKYSFLLGTIQKAIFLFALHRFQHQWSFVQTVMELLFNHYVKWITLFWLFLWLNIMFRYKLYFKYNCICITIIFIIWFLFYFFHYRQVVTHRF